MEISKVYIDMDGVLADFDKGVQELAGFQRLSQEERDDDKVNAMWTAVRAVPHFYDKLEPMPGAISMFHRIYEEYGERCEILTGLPKPYRRIPDAEADKRKWVSRLLSDKIVVNTGIREDKVKFCKDKSCILIDDLRSNIDDWEKHGGTGILFVSNEDALTKLDALGKL